MMIMMMMYCYPTVNNNKGSTEDESIIDDQSSPRLGPEETGDNECILYPYHPMTTLISMVLAFQSQG
jgi:hypothetical protein